MKGLLVLADNKTDLDLAQDFLLIKMKFLTNYHVVENAMNITANLIKNKKKSSAIIIKRFKKRSCNFENEYDWKTC